MSDVPYKACTMPDQPVRRMCVRGGVKWQPHTSLIIAEPRNRAKKTSVTKPIHTASQCHSCKDLYAYYVEKVVRGALYVRQKASGVQTGWRGGAAYALKDKATNTGGAA